MNCSCQFGSRRRKEFERVCTTVVNAYVGPALDRYLGRLAERLAEAGYAGPVLIMQSHGGLATVADAVRLAAGGVLSGPAGGVAGARHASRILGHGNLIAFDMGGTSTDMSLIVDGEAAVSTDRRVAGHRVALHSLDIASIGAGGGSIAHVDIGGVLHVGPASAGADPGPACYGRGGTAPAVTDANLVLGFLDPSRFLGGRQRLDVEAAAAAVDAIAARLGIDRMAAAEGIHRIVNTHMAEGIRLVSVRRGVDPRRFALLSFGGAAGVHVTAVARALDLSRVVVPRLAPVFSAWGMLASDLRYEVVRTHIGDASVLDAGRLDALYREMEAEGRARLAEAAFEGEIVCRRSADMRYGEQIFEVEVPLDGVDWSGPDPIAAIADAFHARHEALYTYSLCDQEAVLVNARVAVVGRLPAAPAEPARAPGPPGAPGTVRRVHLGGWRELAVYDIDAMTPGQRRDDARPEDRRTRHRRVGDHHGAPSQRRPRPRDAARMAGHRHRCCMMLGPSVQPSAPIMTASVADRSVEARLAVAGDAATLAGFNRAMALETEDRVLADGNLVAAVETVLRDSGHGFYAVADTGHELAGALLVTYEWSDWRNGRFWWIQSVYVRPEYRRQGIYRTLHEFVRDRARADGGVVGLRLYVERENVGAQRTYAALGMSETVYRMYEEILSRPA